MSTFNAIHLGADMTPREAVADIINRGTAAFDLGDAALLESAFTEDAAMAISGINRFEGLAAIRADCFTPVSKLDTVHMASNVRVLFADGDGASAKKATATANFQANHYRAGEGVKPDAVGFTTGGIYTLDCVKDEGDKGLWRARSWEVELTWTLGDQSVMTSGAPEEKK
ncbi:uncharacterized protein PG998_009040 [Apiospora kogelbergensis]|uniref:uncharacterized protein n=1 Tax=Apiospora kogelbergensis TaxID=1337665 RepID=UPI00312FDB15